MGCEMREQLVPHSIQADCANLSVRLVKPVLVVLHHTGAPGPGSLEWLRTSRSNVSADFLIMGSGQVYKLNPQLSRFYTWHAGVSRYGKFVEVNPVSFGIELEHVPGEVWRADQLASCVAVVAFLVWKFGIPLRNVVGHKNVAWPRGRKTDPEGFPWREFRAALKAKVGV
ncbi:MAG: hypothetical protein B7Z62_00345 [Deltaproteobacteria bacterium 37-65-8]|nr:MAG: hypothetical protein B7Z62_00345 [Deltaproteobacteria bacterium 37-65-8]